MKFLLAKKEKMLQYFSEDGKALPVTVLRAEPAEVVRVFEKGKDGYEAVQIGAGSRREKRLSRAVRGQMKGKAYGKLKEFRLKPGEKSESKEGDILDVSIFVPGDKLMVSSVSKGKGFQGVVKRHGFKGGPRTHGQKHSEREPGSIVE